MSHLLFNLINNEVIPIIFLLLAHQSAVGLHGMMRVACRRLRWRNLVQSDEVRVTATICLCGMTPEGLNVRECLVALVTGVGLRRIICMPGGHFAFSVLIQTHVKPL